MLYRNCVVLIIGVLASGCIGWQSRNDVPEKIDDFRSQSVTGQTSRDEVHERLGDAFISDDTIEVYRVLEGRDVVVILPAWETREVILYALVVYGDDDVVEDIDWAVYRHDSQADPGSGAPWIRSARLQAGGFLFAAFGTIRPFRLSKREQILLAPQSTSRRALEASPPSGLCTVLVFLKPMEGGKGYERLVHLDGEPVFETPLVSSVYWSKPSGDYWSPYYRRVVTKFLVTEGEHEVKTTIFHRPHEFHSRFECTGGETVYVYPRHRMVDSEPWGIWTTKIRIEGDIENTGSHWRLMPAGNDCSTSVANGSAGTEEGFSRTVSTWR